MALPRVVLDTNVLVAAARSKRGASAKLLSLIGRGHFDICVSVPLVLEYEDAVMRHLEEPQKKLWTDILDFICSVAVQQDVFFLWRPLLRDPNDDMILELAIAANCDKIVSYNKRDFSGATRFGLKVRDPKEFLTEIGALK